jgi:hypothetical protein
VNVLLVIDYLLQALALLIVAIGSSRSSGLSIWSSVLLSAQKSYDGNDSVVLRAYHQLFTAEVSVSTGIGASVDRAGVVGLPPSVLRSILRSRRGQTCTIAAKPPAFVGASDAATVVLSLGGAEYRVMDHGTGENYLNVHETQGPPLAHAWLSASQLCEAAEVLARLLDSDKGLSSVRGYAMLYVSKDTARIFGTNGHGAVIYDLAVDGFGSTTPDVPTRIAIPAPVLRVLARNKSMFRTEWVSVRLLWRSSDPRVSDESAISDTVSTLEVGPLRLVMRGVICGSRSACATYDKNDCVFPFIAATELAPTMFVEDVRALRAALERPEGGKIVSLVSSDDRVFCRSDDFAEGLGLSAYESVDATWVHGTRSEACGVICVATKQLLLALPRTGSVYLRFAPLSGTGTPPADRSPLVFACQSSSHTTSVHIVMFANTGSKAGG